MELQVFIMNDKVKLEIERSNLTAWIKISLRFSQQFLGIHYCLRCLRLG